MIQIGINGAAGRMGQLLCARVLASEGMSLAAATDLAQFSGRDIGEMVGLGPRGIVLTEPTKETYSRCDVIVDFSLAEGTAKLLDCLERQALVIGTTGLAEESAVGIGRHAQGAPVVLAANFSTGANVLQSVTLSA